MTTNDPFPPALSSLQTALTSIPPLLTSLRRITSTSRDPATNPEALAARSDLSSALEDLSADLDDLRASVSAAERDPARFGLSRDEVRGRRNAVEQVGAQVTKLQEASGDFVGLTSPGAPQHAAFARMGDRRDEKWGGTPGLPDPGAFDEEEAEGGDAYNEWEQQRQEELIAEQDEALEGVFNTVGTLRAQADEMGRELEEQGVLIGEL